MLFYEDFVKKIKNGIEEEYKDKEVYRIENKKKLIEVGTGVPLVLIGIFFIWVGYIRNYEMLNFVFGALFFYAALHGLRKIIRYKLVIDNVEKKLIYNDVEIELKTVKSCILQENVIGKKSKKYVVLLELMTYDKEQYLIPLIMDKKEKFVKNMKKLTGEKFKII